MKSKGDPKRKPRAALANPADPLEVGTDRKALIGAKPEFRPCRFEMRPVDAEGLADDQRLGHLPALSPRIIPAAVGIVLVDLVPFLPQARPPLCGAGLVGHISGRISSTGESLLRFLHDGSSSRTLEYWETTGKRIANLQAR